MKNTIFNEHPVCWEILKFHLLEILLNIFTLCPRMSSSSDNLKFSPRASSKSASSSALSSLGGTLSYLLLSSQLDNFTTSQQPGNFCLCLAKKFKFMVEF